MLFQNRWAESLLEDCVTDYLACPALESALGLALSERVALGSLFSFFEQRRWHSVWDSVRDPCHFSYGWSARLVVTIVSTIKRPALVLGADILNTPISLWAQRTWIRIKWLAQLCKPFVGWLLLILNKQVFMEVWILPSLKIKIVFVLKRSSP